MKKVKMTFLKVRNVLLELLSSLRVAFLVIVHFSTFAYAQEHHVKFIVDVTEVENNAIIEIFGNETPLSWDKGIPLNDDNNDSIFEVTIPFKTSSKNVQFRFSKDGKYELDGSDNRVWWFNKNNVPDTLVFNEYPFYETKIVDSLIFTRREILEDITMLKNILLFIHPAIYRYRDSITLQSDFKELESKLLLKPTLKDAYIEISKFLSLIKCSHTFLNPWNQGATIDKAFFYQPDKLPLTFNRLGKQLFIEKDASEKFSLKKGKEILSINGIETSEVLNRLANYVTSDGNNFEKKLSRLEIDGTEKFAYFDIYFPLEFGSSNTYTLRIKDWATKEITEVKVQSISKTKRTAIVNKRYGKLETNFKDGWNFEVINASSAVLTIKSFAVQDKAFKWKYYLGNVFKKAKKEKVKNLIIDIRSNEGGDGAVGKYILERIIQQTIELPGMQVSVRYKRIPASFKKLIHTWDNIPYDFSGDIDSERNGVFILKDKYGIPSKTYKPRKDGFKGQVYLITDAANSSATHLMATYAKMLDNVTVVGQETGGNNLGTNGGYIFFMKLPNSKIVVDIPVLAQQIKLPKAKLIDGGIMPDIYVQKTASDYISGKDVEMAATIKFIEKNKDEKN